MVEDSPQGATLILLSDGLETCGGDPCRAVRLAKERLAKERLAKEHGKQLVLHVVGFDISGQDTSQLQCMAQAGGGLFFNAENAEGLAEALEAAVALPVDAPVGRLAVLGMADDQLHDVAVQVTGSEGKVMATARTYTGAETNPSSIPLADGTYEVRVLGVGLEGEPEQRFSISIVDGNTVEKTVDFSTGTLSIGVQRNGSLSDAVFRVYVSGTRREVASGRTYVSASTNPAEVRLTAGTYEVEVGSVEIADRPWQKLGTVEIAAKAEVAVEHEFKSGTLKIGAVDSAERVDAVVRVVSAEGGKSIAQGRTYTDSKTNPKTFELEPGHYRIQVTSMGQGKRRQEFEAEVRVGETVELDADFGKDAP